MRVRTRVVTVGVTAAALTGLLGGPPASANTQTSPTCWSSTVDDGQFADFTLSNLGAHDLPGLSAFTPPRAGFSVGDFTVGFQSDTCGLH
jgi:hypothetical protein